MKYGLGTKHGEQVLMRKESEEGPWELIGVVDKIVRKYERKPMTNAERVAAHRARKKNAGQNETITQDDASKMQALKI